MGLKGKVGREKLADADGAAFRLAVMVYICNPSIWGAEAGGSPFGIQPSSIDSNI